MKCVSCQSILVVFLVSQVSGGKPSIFSVFGSLGLILQDQTQIYPVVTERAADPRLLNFSSSLNTPEAISTTGSSLSGVENNNITPSSRPEAISATGTADVSSEATGTENKAPLTTTSKPAHLGTTGGQIIGFTASSTSDGVNSALTMEDGIKENNDPPVSSQSSINEDNLTGSGTQSSEVNQTVNMASEGVKLATKEVHNTSILGTGLNLSEWTVTLAVSGFALGVLLMCLAAFLVYRRKKNKWSERYFVEAPNHIPNDLRDADLQSIFTEKYGRSECKDVTQALHAIPENTLQMQLSKNIYNQTKDFTKGDKIFTTNPPLEATDIQGPRSTYMGTESIFVVQFSGMVTSEGGIIQSPESEVSIHVPPGAVPAGRVQAIHVNVSLNPWPFNLVLGDDEVQLTPVVECLAPGLNSFLKPVTVVLPHRAYLHDDQWSMCVQYSQSPVGSIMAWHDIPAQKINNKKQAISYSFDDRYVRISTTHFTTYTCSGCGKNKKLRLSAVAFGNYQDFQGHQQVNFRTYICDDFVDAQKRILELEGPLGGRQRTQYQPLVMRNSKNWEIKLISADDQQWPWKLHHQDEVTKVIPVELTYHCCGTPPSVNFRCLSKANCQPGIEATFQVAQLRRKRSEMVPVELLTHNFNFTSESQTGHELSKYLEMRLSQAQVNYIENQLSPQDLPTLARNLGLTDAQLDVIKSDHQNNSREQTHQAIVHWQRLNGQMATAGKFCKALERSNLKLFAEELERLEIIA
ncbi:uncharacterized protein LOC106166144 [Lingula anatina]|uniref:Netrin receptor UNC5 n=1 Tax=Lingula anatina TaxID=7574 RepID=A0A1S3IPA8_LINAN|nr:uncharacterized protein LOC106166144 [Lingula anatina]|eukprot:XP_013400055.1 uncharacterized protein LOC106166144 [Lingula anatina]